MKPGSQIQGPKEIVLLEGKAREHIPEPRSDSCMKYARVIGYEHSPWLATTIGCVLVFWWLQDHEY